MAVVATAWRLADPMVATLPRSRPDVASAIGQRGEVVKKRAAYIGPHQVNDVLIARAQWPRGASLSSEVAWVIKKFPGSSDPGRHAAN